MTKRLFFILSLIFPLFAFAAKDQLLCGNGTIVVNLTADDDEEQINILYPKLSKTFSITLSDHSKKNAIRLISQKEDMNTGELTSQWQSGTGTITHRTFVSHKDNIAVMLITTDKGATEQTTIKTKAPKDFIKVIPDDGKMNVSSNEVTLKNCRQALVLISLDAIDIAGILGVTDNKSRPSAIAAYSTLFQRHFDIYNQIYENTSLALNTGNPSDTEIADIYNILQYKSICYGEAQAVETNNFSALPKMSELVKSEIQASFLFDYYLYTLDTNFLQNKALPQMLKAADDLEKTLKNRDSFGFYILSKNSPTMEVTAAIFLLRDLITTCNILQVYQERVGHWMDILSFLPPYKIDVNEEFRRSLLDDEDTESVPGELVAESHPDVPHLLALLYRNDPIIMRNYDLREGCKLSIARAKDYRQSARIKGIDAGFIQLALSSAAVGDSETAYNLLLDSKAYWTASTRKELAPVINKMLVQSYYSPETSKCYLNLLSATPAAWTKGKIKGAAIRGGITLKEMKWDTEEGLNATLVSKTDIKLEIFIRGKLIQTVELQAGVPHSIVAKRK